MATASRSELNITESSGRVHEQQGGIQDHVFFQYSELRIDEILCTTLNMESDVAASTFIAEGSPFGFMLGYHWHTKSTESS